MTTTIQQPLHEHDCDYCKFKGSFLEFDLWVHPDYDGDATHDELIVRRSSRDGDYLAVWVENADLFYPYSKRDAAMCYLRDLHAPCKGDDCAKLVRVQTGYSKRGSYKTKWSFCVHKQNQAVKWYDGLNTHSGYKKRLMEYGFVTARVLT